MLYVTMFFCLIGANGLPFKMKRYNFKRSVKYTFALGSKKINNTNTKQKIQVFTKNKIQNGLYY